MPLLALSFIAISWAFHGWLGQYRTAVREAHGLVEFDATGLSHRFAWGWTSPSLSVVLQDDPNEAVILSPSWKQDPWQPFDPARPLRPASGLHG